MAHITHFLLALCICLSSAVFAVETPQREASPQTLEELKIAIEKVRVDTKAPAIGVALVDKNGPYWVAGLGEVDLATHKPADENSIFRIGSTSKMFVALSVLKLVEEGKLHLNDKLSDLAPEIYFDNPWEKTNPILLVHLLEHTTGWDDIGFAVYGRQDANISLKDAVDFHPQYRKSRWIPGTRMAYTNGGPGVTAYIVQKISGQTYEDYVQTHFFNPLRMNSTSFFETELFKQRGVSLYSADAKPQPYWNIIVRPSGAINSSVSDMASYLHFLIARGSFNQQQILNEASIARMETPTTSLGAQAGALAGYGLHNYVDGFEEANIAFRGHDGDVSGGHCKLRYVSELQTGYVFLINQDNIEAINKITKLIRGFLLKDVHKTALKEIPLPEKFKKLSGYYIAINPRSDISRLATDVFSVMRFSVSNNRLHREPLLGGWEKPSSDYAINENILASNWTGLPNIAIVNDPLAGQAVEVTDSLVGSLYQKVSPIRVFGVLGWIALTAFLTLTSVGFALVWLVQRARGKITKGVAISIRIWPLVTSAVLIFAVFTPNIFQSSIEDMGRVSPVTIATFLSSLLLPALAVFSFINCVRYRHAQVNQVMYWHSVAVSVSHCGFAIILAYYGLIGIRMWA
jgi:CubicO group peptidase (beta-lactamase class C family)